MSPFVAAAAQLLGRALLSVIFIIGGLGKIAAPGPTIGYIASSGLPYPELAYYASVVIELGGGLAIMFGLQTRLVGLALALFCIVTGIVFHFHPGNAAQMTQYLKNLAMAGGFLQLFALGGGLYSVDAMLLRRKG